MTKEELQILQRSLVFHQKFLSKKIAKAGLSAAQLYNLDKASQACKLILLQIQVISNIFSIQTREPTEVNLTILNSLALEKIITAKEKEYTQSKKEVQKILEEQVAKIEYDATHELFEWLSKDADFDSQFIELIHPSFQVVPDPFSFIAGMMY